MDGKKYRSVLGCELVICITSHLEGLKAICQDCSQSISLSRSCCKLSWSVCLLVFSSKHCIISEKFEGGSWMEIWVGMSFK